MSEREREREEGVRETGVGGGGGSWLSRPWWSKHVRVKQGF